MHSSLYIWMYAARPKTLFIGAFPILLGSLLAFRQDSFSSFILIMCFIGALSIQIGTNYSNDYFDFVKQADNASRKGSYKVLERGLVSLQAMKTAFIICFIIAGIITSFLIQQGGWIILAVSLLCIFLSIAYTAPPLPLAYLGLGDVFVLVFYGPVATLTTYYLHTHTFNPSVLLIAFLPGILGLGPLIMNNLRDVEQDAKVNKRTLIVRWGERFGRNYFLMIMLLALILPYIDAALFSKNPFIVLTSFAFLPLKNTIYRLFSHDDKKELQPLFIASAQIIPLFTLLFALSELAFYVFKSLFV